LLSEAKILYMRCYYDSYVNIAICDKLTFLKHVNINEFRNGAELFAEHSQLSVLEIVGCSPNNWNLWLHVLHEY